MSRKYIKIRRFKNHPLGWKYRIHQYGFWNFTYYDFKSDALAHARIMLNNQGGEWVVNRVFPSMKVQHVKTFGGYADDWPGDRW